MNYNWIQDCCPSLKRLSGILDIMTQTDSQLNGVSSTASFWMLQPGSSPPSALSFAYVLVGAARYQSSPSTYAGPMKRWIGDSDDVMIGLELRMTQETLVSREIIVKWTSDVDNLITEVSDQILILPVLLKRRVVYRCKAFIGRGVVTVSNSTLVTPYLGLGPSLLVLWLSLPSTFSHPGQASIIQCSQKVQPELSSPAVS